MRKDYLRRRAILVLATAAAAATSPAALAQVPVIDGSKDASYGTAISVQTVNTGFGDNQSELDAVYSQIIGGKLHLFLSGNLESNFNKMVLFFDTRAGGQNVMRADNPNIDFNNLNDRYAGMTFDTGFDADYTLFYSRDTANIFVNFSELNTNGGGLGGFVGQVETPGFPQQGAGTIGGTGGLPTVQLGYNDSNIAGVTGDAPNAADPVAAAAVSTGSEIVIDLPALGATENFRMFIGINGSTHDFWSNQFAPGLTAPQGNLGSDGLGNFVPHPTLPQGGSVSAVNFNNFAGDQFLTVTYHAPLSEWNNGNGNWSEAGKWTGDGVPDQLDARAVLGTIGGATPKTITLDTDVELQSLTFNNAGGYTIAASGVPNVLRIAGNPATPSIVVTAGDHTIAAPLQLGATTNVAIAAGASLSVLNLSAAGQALVKTDAGIWRVPSFSAESLNIVDGTVAIQPTVGAPSASQVNALIVAGTPSNAKLDLTRHGFVVNYTPPPPQPEGGGNSPFEEIRALIIAGRNGGAWNGNGITSSQANDTTTAVGYAEASDVLGATGGTFLGQTVDGDAVLFRLTRVGDANLDGTTNIQDFSRLAANFNQAGNWASGDFNYDGQTNIQDFSKLASNFNQSVPADAGRPGAVPEPAALALLAAAGLILPSRRRR